MKLVVSQLNFKRFSKGKKSKKHSLENKQKFLDLWYINGKNQLEEIYDDIAEGIKVRSECQWYEEGEKSTNFFLNLDKTMATQGTVKKLEINNKEIDNPVEINKELKKFFENYLKGNLEKRNMHPMNFLEIFHYLP